MANNIESTKVFRNLQKAYDLGFTQVDERGGSRSGKTYNTILWLLVMCMAHPDITVSVVRKTFPALKGSVLRDADDIINRLEWGAFIEKNKTDHVYTFPAGNWIEFFSCDNEAKLRGRKRVILYANEANELSYMEWQQLKLRTERMSIADYNPSITEDHWLATYHTDPKTFAFITTYRDNPFLPPAIIEEIESLQKKNESLWRIYGIGQIAVVEGLVFTNVDVVDDIPVWVKRRWTAIDFGYSSDPTAIVTVAILDNDLYVDEVCYMTKMLTSDIIAVLRGSDHKVISESADPRLVDEIANGGIDIHPVSKYQGSVMAGINKMKEYRIHLTRRSVNVQKEFKNYVWAQNKDGVWLQKPVDLYNHAIDAVRYVILEEVLGKNNDPLDFKSLRKFI